MSGYESRNPITSDEIKIGINETPKYTISSTISNDEVLQSSIVSSNPGETTRAKWQVTRKGQCRVAFQISVNGGTNSVQCVSKRRK